MKVRLIILILMIGIFFIIKLQTEEEISQKKVEVNKKDYEEYIKYIEYKQRYEKSLNEYETYKTKKVEVEDEGFVCNSKTNRPKIILHETIDTQRKPHNISEDYANEYLAYNKREAELSSKIYYIKDMYN